jgi:hypothetical protein
MLAFFVNRIFLAAFFLTTVRFIFAGCLIAFNHLGWLTVNQVPIEELKEPFFHIMFMGFRFDLVVVGFAFSVIWLLWNPVFMEFLRSSIFSLTNLIFSFLVGFMAILYVIGFTFLIRYGFHPREVLSANTWNHFFYISDFNPIQITSFILVGLILMAAATWYSNGGWYSDEYVDVHFGNWIITGIVLFVCARGTIGTHHLRREDCELTQSKTITEFCLNPIWTYDKPINP